MKINYFKYHFKNKSAQTIYFDIRQLIQGFVNNASNDFKSKFKLHDDNLYLIKTTETSLYFFTRTRNDAVIQKINNNDYTIEDIRDNLKDDEFVGFSSYVYIGEDYLGFASNYLSPGVSYFSDFINQIIKEIDPTIIFEAEALLSSITKKEAKSLKFISRAYVKVPVERSAWEDTKEFLGADNPIPTKNLSYFEVTLKAKKNEHINESTFGLLDAYNDAERFVIKAKANLEDNLRDYYINESGILSDNIYKGKKSHETEAKMVEKIKQNIALKGAIIRSKQDDKGKNYTISSIIDYISSNNWSN